MVDRRVVIASVIGTKVEKKITHTKDDDIKVDPPRAPHALCGLVHERRQCKYCCKECVKPHPEKDCYILYPEKAPKG